MLKAMRDSARLAARSTKSSQLNCIGAFARHTVILLACSFGLLACEDNDPEPPTEEKPSADIMYMVMPDRFYNADTANDTGGISGERDAHGFDPSDMGFYHGGDLAGLHAKLPYLQQLGVTALWITPIFENLAVAPDGLSSAYHGYWIKNFSKIDPHFGTNQEFQNLVEDAHKQGIKVFLDIVINHTADIIRFTECHTSDGSLPEGQNGCTYRDSSQAPYTPFIPEGLENAKTPAWLNDPAVYHNRGDSSFLGESALLGDFFGLDDIDTSQQVVVDGMIDIFKYWIEEFNIDGFRLDTAIHVDMQFWQQWAPAINTFAKQQGIDNFTIFGETYNGDPVNISRYSTSGKLDSVLDFGFYFALKDVVADNQAPSRIAEIFAQDDYYTDSNSRANDLYTFASNHDVGRIAYHIKHNNPEESEAQHLARLRMAYAMLYFARGIPVIYYGDEQGFSGGEGDKLSREDMMPSLVEAYNNFDLLGTDKTAADDNFDTEHTLFKTLSEYAALLQNHPALARGQQITRLAENEPGILAFSRIGSEKTSVDDSQREEYLVVYNTSLQTKTVDIPVAASSFNYLLPSSESTIDANNNSLSISLDALSIVILKSQQAIASDTVTQISLDLIPGQKVKNRYSVGTEVVWGENSSSVTTRVDFYVALNDGAFVLAGSDHSAPFNLHPFTEGAEGSAMVDGDQLTWKAVAITADGVETASETVTVEVGAPPGMKVFFKAPEGWGSNVSLYYWDVANQESVDWPGVAMEQLDPQWFYFEFPDGVQESKLIFNDGTQQTTDLFRRGSGCFSDEQWQDVCEDAPQPGIKLRFQKPADWANTIYLYFWNADNADSVPWPGLAMQQISNGWYELRLPANVQQANIIFTDNQGNQTDDLFRQGDGCFAHSDSEPWSDQCEISMTTTIENAAAHWVDGDHVVWVNAPSAATHWALFSSPSATLTTAEDDTGQTVIVGADSEFALSPATLPVESAEKFRHLSSAAAFSFTASESEKANLLKAQLVVAAYNENNELVAATLVQTPGAIDALFSTSLPLGVDINGESITASLWAPTAQNVQLKIYDTDFSLLQTVEATSVDEGVWQFTGDTELWLDAYYQYAISAYHPISNTIEHYDISDPYALSLSQNGAYAQFVDLDQDASLKPEGWDALQKSLPAAKDISIYEGHVRSFSAYDQKVPAAERGKYLAFTYNGQDGKGISDGMQHLQTLQQAGLTHFHLLPVNDIATVDEDSAHTVALDESFDKACTLVDAPELQQYCEQFSGQSLREVFQGLAFADPATETIQEITHALRQFDNFNWGYDPLHFFAPDGSYAVDSSTKMRILEFRKMVKALDQIGLNVVVDVVFNHTSASGLWDNSILDRAVPGYYHRRNSVTGKVEMSTCCDNTAAEHQMMERLMIDALITWAKYYKIDAFRFDLMGHHPKSVLENIRQALSHLTLENDGVDGANIYLYGEGWDFGEVSGNQRFDQATQYNMGGTGIGTFNDRLRSAVRGGNFSDNGRAQGFANGNGSYWNGVADGAAGVNDQADRIRIGLAGNLRHYPFEDNSGSLTTGEAYAGVGYNLSPIENVVYVDKHDNETLWDNSQAKLPDDLTMEERVRVQALSQSFVNFAQGIPFHQMGTDLLRSKSLHRNSYDAGDWANQVDFSLQSHNWASGMPEASENDARWDTIRSILNNSNIRVQPSDLTMASNLFQDQLRIRYSSELFRLGDTEQVAKRVAFWNTGSEQNSGVIAMSISNGDCAQPSTDQAEAPTTNIDTERDGLIIIFNSTADTRALTLQSLAGLSLQLHEVQQSGSDTRVKAASYQSLSGEFTVPARTVAVFEAPHEAGNSLFPCNPHYGQVLTPGFSVYVQQPTDWPDMRIFYWDTAPNAHSTNWPGDDMLAISDGWYRYQLPAGVSAANIIFNSSNSAQTANLYREGNGCYDFATSQWYALGEQCLVPGMQIQFTKPEAWASTIYLYYWNAAIDGPTWPGTPMVLKSDASNSAQFELQLPDGVRQSNLIFHDNEGQQTADLFRREDGCFDAQLGWQDTCQNQ